MDTPDGETIVDHLAGVEDYTLAMATYRAAIKRWPNTPITLQQGARVIEDSRCVWRRLTKAGRAGVKPRSKHTARSSASSPRTPIRAARNDRKRPPGARPPDRVRELLSPNLSISATKRSGLLARSFCHRPVAFRPQQLSAPLTLHSYGCERELRPDCYQRAGRLDRKERQPCTPARA